MKSLSRLIVSGAHALAFMGMVGGCGGGDDDAPAKPADLDDTPAVEDASRSENEDSSDTGADEPTSFNDDSETMDAGAATPPVIQPGSSLDPTQNVTTTAAPNVCVLEDAIKILFAPSYSAYDGAHSFKVPMVIPGVDPTLVEWTTSDDSKVRHTRDDSFGGEMFETTGSGDVTIFASIGNICGHAVLHITQATPEQWQKGSDRYHNGAFVMNLGQVTRPNSTTRTIDCTNCHGAKDSSTNSLGTVEHTPMQTAGYSDSDLKNIFMHGTTPNGLLAQPISNLTYDTWHGFHQWVMADDAEADGVVTYLRSITPAPTGNGDFGGAFGMMGRGGFDGGFPMRPDGGFPRPNDAGVARTDQ